MGIFHSKKFLCQYAHIPWNLIVSIGREYTADPVEVVQKKIFMIGQEVWALKYLVITYLWPYVTVCESKTWKI